MSRRLRPAALLTAGLLLSALIGCGPGGPRPLTGTVTLDGKPLARVAVSLVPEAGGPSLSGSSDDQGAFALLPPAGQEVAGGGYKVVVTDPNAKGAGGKAARADDPYAAGQAATSNPPIPPKFTSAQTTTHKVTVEPGKPLAIDLPPK